MDGLTGPADLAAIPLFLLVLFLLNLVSLPLQNAISRASSGPPTGPPLS